MSIGWRRLLAEGLGTFGLVFAGCGAVVANELSGGAVTHVGVSIVFGAIVMMMIVAFGPISGAHINPAVTIALWAARQFEAREIGGVGPAFAMEVLLTTILMLVIMACAVGHQLSAFFAGLTIGATVALCALFGGPLTGASMNPARSLGPAVVSGDVSVLWLYCAAPVLGALVAVFLYKLLWAETVVD